MPTNPSAGARCRAALQEETPLQVVARHQRQPCPAGAARGFSRHLHLSGGGVAAGSLGLPDLGISGLEDVLIDVRRITDGCDTPLLVDVDTGFGASFFNVVRTTKAMIKASAV